MRSGRYFRRRLLARWWNGQSCDLMRYYSSARNVLSGYKICVVLLSADKISANAVSCAGEALSLRRLSMLHENMECEMGIVYCSEPIVTSGVTRRKTEIMNTRGRGSIAQKSKVNRKTKSLSHNVLCLRKYDLALRFCKRTRCAVFFSTPTKQLLVL